MNHGIKYILRKADKLEDENGILTRAGERIARQYAQAWLKGQRRLDMERAYPQLMSLFYDLRIDRAFAQRSAQE